MRDEVKARCESMIANRDTLQKVFGWGTGILWVTGACMFAMKGKTAEAERLKQCRDMIKEKTGIFSGFRGNAKSLITATLALGHNPEGTLENGLTVYKMLKQKMWDSSYLPMVAMSIARLAAKERYEEIVEKTKLIYDLIKKEHPFLTSAEDSSFCALLALSEKSAEELVTEAETCYQYLTKHTGFPKNSVQSLSHVLALCDGLPEEKCEKTKELYEILKARGSKYGTTYELPMLGVLAMKNHDFEALAEELAEVSSWLSKQKGFGFWGSVTTKQRLMFAGMLLQEQEEQNELSETTLIQSAVAIVVAQEAAMLAMMSASTAAAVTAANS